MTDAPEVPTEPLPGTPQAGARGTEEGAAPGVVSAVAGTRAGSPVLVLAFRFDRHGMTNDGHTSLHLRGNIPG